MNFQEKISSQIRSALTGLSSQIDVNTLTINLQETKPEFEGDLTLVCFPFTKAIGKSPEQIGQAIGEYLEVHSPEIVRFNVVKGFLNLVIADSVWNEEIKAWVDSKVVDGLAKKEEKVLVEFSSPNTNKPLHLGHLRTNFLGASLSNLLQFAGYQTTRCNLVNDRGIHICKSMLAYLETGNGETPESSGIKGDHLVGRYYVRYDQIFKKQVAELVKSGKTEDEAKTQAPILLQTKQMLLDWENGKSDVMELWQKMNSWVYAGFGETYKRLGIYFDKFYYESETYLLGKDIVDEGLAKGIFFKKEDGSVWIDLTAEGLDQKLVLRADGTSVYITQDLGTADLKFQDFGMNRSIYVVGNEQDYHFVVLFHILKKLGRSYGPGLYHLSYGMVDLPSGKMKSREGTVVDADELVSEMVQTAKDRTNELGKIADFEPDELDKLYEVLGIGAIKYFLLKVDPKKRMLFNPEESIELHGNTATAIQYTHARIQAISRKASQLNISGSLEFQPSVLKKSERELLIHLLNFEAMIAEAADGYSPAVVANYLYETSRKYNSFFAAETIFQAETPELVQFRVALSVLTGRTIRTCGNILGIEMPERM